MRCPAELGHLNSIMEAGMRLRNAGIVALLICVCAFTGSAVDVTGTWQGQATDPQGSAHDLTLNLKADGNTLTGTILMKRAPQAISNGKIDGDQISFDVVASGPDQGADSQKLTFTAKVTGNQMQGSATLPGGDKILFTLTRVPAGSAPAAPQPAAAEPTVMQPPNPQGSNPQPEDAQTAILAAFDKYAIVAGMGVTNKDTDDLILALIRNPAFAAKVNDIAVECGNALYQPMLDRYIAGEDVPLAAVRPVWRNTTQPSCSFSAFYEELFPLVRRSNEKLPPERKLRMLACDPPVDWSRVQSAEDLRPFTARDRSIA